MSRIRIYFEGDPKLKKSLQAFVHKAVPGTRGKLRLVSGGGRDQAIDDFLAAVKLHHHDSFVMLLIDSEAEDDGRLFQQLQQKTNWRVPSGASINDRQVCWMVQCMEAWLVADRDALRSYYGAELSESSLPSNPRVDACSKGRRIGGAEKGHENYQERSVS